MRELWPSENGERHLVPPSPEFTSRDCELLIHRNLAVDQYPYETLAPGVKMDPAYTPAVFPCYYVLVWRQCHRADRKQVQVQKCVIQRHCKGCSRLLPEDDPIAY
jgi:hypothetical protein